MDDNKLINYLSASDEVGSGIGDDHIQVFEAGVRHGLRQAREAGNHDIKLISALESVLIDLRYLVEEVNGLLEEADGELSQEGQPPFIAADKAAKVLDEVVV